MVERYYAPKRRLHPATALLPIILIIATVRFPPYSVDPLHWTIFVGPGLDVAKGYWPYLHNPSGYGFLPAGVMGIILKLFPFSAFTAYALVAITTALAGIAAYFLVNKMVNSKWLSLVIVTLLLFGFNSFEQAIQYPNSGALRFEFMQAVTLLLAWHILSTNGSKGLAAAFLFGIFLLWDPAFQAFAALPLAGGLLYQRFVRKDGIALKKMICTALSALATMLVVVIFSAKLPDGGIKGVIERTAGMS